MNFSLIHDIKLLSPILLRHSMCGPWGAWPYDFSLIHDVKLMGPILLRHSVCGLAAESSGEQWPYPSWRTEFQSSFRSHRYALEKPGKLYTHACLFKERRRLLVFLQESWERIEVTTWWYLAICRIKFHLNPPEYYVCLSQTFSLPCPTLHKSWALLLST